MPRLSLKPCCKPTALNGWHGNPATYKSDDGVELAELSRVMRSSNHVWGDQFASICLFTLRSLSQANLCSWGTPSFSRAILTVSMPEQSVASPSGPAKTRFARFFAGLPTCTQCAAGNRSSPTHGNGSSGCASARSLVCGSCGNGSGWASTFARGNGSGKASSVTCNGSGSGSGNGIIA